MSDYLEKKLIRLAFEKPNLRGDLLPLILKTSSSTLEKFVLGEMKKAFRRQGLGSLLRSCQWEARSMKRGSREVVEFTVSGKPLSNLGFLSPNLKKKWKSSMDSIAAQVEPRLGHYLKLRSWFLDPGEITFMYEVKE